MRKLLYLLALTIALCLPNRAQDIDYLSMETIERDLTQEIGMQEEVTERQKEDREAAIDMLDSMERRYEELHFVVYFQNNANFFFLTYYCAQISDLAMEYATGQQPIVRMRSRLSLAIQRFSHMRQMLESLRRQVATHTDTYYPEVDTAEETAALLARIDQNIDRCRRLEDNNRRMYDALEADAQRYKELGKRIHRLDVYANGRFVEQYAHQLSERQETAMRQAVDTEPDECVKEEQKTAAPGLANEAEREEAMLQATAKALGVDCNVNNAEDLTIDKDLQTEGRLAARISMILWDPDSPFRTVQLPQNTIGRRLAASAASIRANYLIPSDVPKMHHLFGYFGLIFGVSLLLWGLTQLRHRRHAYPRTPRRSVFNRAKLCVVLALVSYAFSLWESVDFLKEGEAFAGGFLLLTALFYTCCAVSFNSRMALHGARALTPLVQLCFCLVAYSLIMCPTIVFTETLPVVFAAATVATACRLFRRLIHFGGLLRTLSIFTLVLLAIGFCTSFCGYSFLTMIGTFSWYIVLLCVMLVHTSPHLTRFFIRKINTSGGQKFNMAYISGWVNLLFRYLLTPYLVIGLLWFGLYWAADGIDLGHFVRSWMGTTTQLSEFIRSFSVDRLLFITCVGIMLHFILRMIQLSMTGGQGPAMGVSGSLYLLGRIVATCIFAIFALTVLDADYNSLLVVMGGLSVGIGLGMKDSLQDVASGLTLMLGRLRPGDVITCDDFLGCVTSIGLRATWVDAYDGTSVCFQNTALLSKNFRNLTRKHAFVRKKVEVGVAYGTDTALARKIALSAVQRVKLLSPHHESLVWVENLDNSAVQLSVVVWVPANFIPQTLSLVRETVYAAFHRNGIEIPFPQCDVHMK